MGNCERERKILQYVYICVYNYVCIFTVVKVTYLFVCRLSEKTSSIWNYMYSKEAEFRDPLYDPNSSEFIFPSTDIRQFK